MKVPFQKAISAVVIPEKLSSGLVAAQVPYHLPVGLTVLLDLWDVLFSRHFSVLVEDLLRESFGRVHTGLLEKAETVLMTLRKFPSPAHLTAVEMAWTAEQLGKYLCREVGELGTQAGALLQDGDAQAKSAMAVALVKQKTRLAAQVVSTLRALTTALGAEGSLDGVLILARLARYLRQHLGEQLHLPSDGKAQRSEGGGIDLVQLESAFTIADTRGCGELNSQVIER